MSLFSLIRRLVKVVFPSELPKENNPLRIGILGAARIAPHALITPARTHPGVVVAGVAARDVNKAREYAKKHEIPRVFNTYEEMLNDSDIDAIYNPLPNGLHYEWTVKALNAGKHVLLEKPSTNTVEEIRELFQIAKERRLVLLEAFHYRFHPAIQRVKEIIDSGELGNIKSVTADNAVPRGFFADDDIRYQFDLGGGALMDMGTYTVSAIRYLLGGEPMSVISAEAEPHYTDPKVDRNMHAVLEFPNSITAELYCSLGMPGRGPFGLIPAWPRVDLTVNLEGGTVVLSNYVLPTLYHTLTVTPTKGKKRTEKVYRFKDGYGENWMTYRYQLEAFVAQVRGRAPQTWISEQESVGQMEVLESIYKKAGLPVRPASSFKYT
jgi:predicted dehydrogenase